MASLALGAWRGPGGLAGLAGGIPVSYGIDQEAEEVAEGQVREKIRETLELGVRRMNLKEIKVAGTAAASSKGYDTGDNLIPLKRIQFPPPRA